METINDGITDGRETARMKCHLLVDKRHGNLVARHIFARAVPARGRDCLVDLHTQQTSNNQLVCLYRTTAVPRENKRIPNDTSLSMHSFSSTPPFLSLSLSLSLVTLLLEPETIHSMTTFCTNVQVERFVGRLCNFEFFYECL